MNKTIEATPFLSIEKSYISKNARAVIVSTNALGKNLKGVKLITGSNNNLYYKKDMTQLG